MAITDAQFDRLPKYAADEIKQLRREVERVNALLAELAQDPKGASVTWNEGFMQEHALPDGASVQFRHGRTHIECRMDKEGVLHIHGSRSILVKPQASNAAHVMNETE